MLVHFASLTNYLLTVIYVTNSFNGQTSVFTNEVPIEFFRKDEFAKSLIYVRVAY